MENMNWGVWFRGAIQALSSGLITALVAIAVLKQMPTTWELFMIAGVPVAMGFLAYVKQTPPPFGYKLIKQTPQEIVESIPVPKIVK